MADVEIGIGKTGRQGYGFDEVAIVPSRRTRDPADVSIGWEIDAYRFGLPMLSSPTDSVASPQAVVEICRLGGLGVLNLDGLWTRYADPEPLLARIAAEPEATALSLMRELYAEPVRPDLITRRIGEVRDAGMPVSASLSPQLVTRFAPVVLGAGVDLLVVHGTVVSAEHLSTGTEPLNLKRFIGELDVPVVVGGCASFSTALHLMRTGAAGLLVGVGSGRAGTARAVLGVGVPMATAVADAAGARARYLDETGGRYVHVIADGGMRTGGHLATAIACGADAVMLGRPLARADGAPGRGFHWSMAAVRGELPRGHRVPVGTVGTLAEVLLGPATTGDGTTNLFGALRRALATTGYPNLKEFQRAEVIVGPRDN